MLVTATHQVGQDVSVSFDKEALKLISKVANHAFFSSEANWRMVSIVFKHNSSNKRLTSGFKNNFTKTDNVKVKANMTSGEVYELHEIIISGPNRQPKLSIKRSEIENASSMDLTLGAGSGGGGVTPDPVTLALSTASNSVLQAFSVTAAFSESVTGFALSDISVTNGTASNLSGSGANYSFTITPTSDGQISVSVPQGSATASSNVSNNASNSLSVTYYSPASLTLSTTSNQVIAAFNVDAEFSKSVTGFALSDISVTNGTASNLSGSGANYSFTVTPSADGNVDISVAAESATAAGGAANTASNSLSVTYYAPVSVTLSTASNSVSQAFSVTAAFSKSVTGFALGDISVTNGTASNLSGLGSSYTFDVTPSADGNVAVSVLSGSILGAGGETNTASNSLSVAYAIPENLYTGATGSNWNTASNWSLNSVPKIAGDFARFNNATAHSVNLDADVILTKLQLDKGQQTISSSSSKKITFDGSNEQVIVNYAAATSSNAPTISAGVILTDNLSFSGGPIKISGAITGTGATINNRSTTLDLLSSSNSFASATINNYKTLHAASGALGGSPTINLDASENNVEFVATLASGAVNFNCPEGREIALSSYNKPTTFSAPVTLTGTIDGALKIFHYANPNNINLSAASFSNVTFGNNSKIIIDGNGTNGSAALPLNLNGNVKIEIGKKSGGSSTNIVNAAFPSSQTVINNPIEFYGSPDAGCTTYLGLNGANSVLNGNVVLDAGGNAASGTKFYFTTSSATAMTINGNISGTSHANTSGVTLFVTNALNLNGTNTFTNPITIQGSGIILRVNGSMTSNVTVNSSNGLLLNGTNAGNVTLAGNISGNGTNTGNVTTSGSSSRIYTYNNNTPIVSSRVNDILTVNGNLTSTSSFAFYPYTNTTEGPNKVSKLRVNGNVNVTNGITITFNMIANPGAGSYRVMEYTGTWTGSPTFAVTGTGWTTGVTVNHDTVAKTITLVKA